MSVVSCNVWMLHRSLDMLLDEHAASFAGRVLKNLQANKLIVHLI